MNNDHSLKENNFSPISKTCKDILHIFTPIFATNHKLFN